MSIMIGEHVQNVLHNNAKISAALGDRIYPMVIPEGTPAYPFAVFVDSDTAQYGTKDGDEELSQVSVAVVAKTYGQATELAQSVKTLLEGADEAKYEQFVVTDTRYTGCEKTYLDEIDAFCVTVNMEFETHDIL
jgi:hypothetical protein